MANNEFTIPIPARLKNVAKGGHVAGAKDIIDDALGKEQSEINQDRIDDIVEVKGGSTKSIADLSEDIANEVERASGVEAGLRESIDELGQIGLNPDNAISTDGDDFDGDTTAKRSKIPTIGAIIDGNPGVYDISKRNPTGGPNNDGKFTLEYILDNANTLIPTAVRRGGMSIKFVQSSDNKYVQFRLMKNQWSTTPSDWQGVDDNPVVGSKNLVESKGVAIPLNQIMDEKEIILNKTFDANGNIISSKTKSISQYIEMPASQNLRVGPGSSGNSVYCVYDQNKNYLAQQSITAGSGTAINWSSLQPTAKYIRVAFNTNDSDGFVRDNTGGTLGEYLWKPFVSWTKVINDEKERAENAESAISGNIETLSSDIETNFYSSVEVIHGFIRDTYTNVNTRATTKILLRAPFSMTINSSYMLYQVFRYSLDGTYINDSMSIPDANKLDVDDTNYLYRPVVCSKTSYSTPIPDSDLPNIITSFECQYEILKKSVSNSIPLFNHKFVNQEIEAFKTVELGIELGGINWADGQNNNNLNFGRLIFNIDNTRPLEITVNSDHMYFYTGFVYASDTSNVKIGAWDIMKKTALIEKNGYIRVTVKRNDGANLTSEDLASTITVRPYPYSDLLDSTKAYERNRLNKLLVANANGVPTNRLYYGADYKRMNVLFFTDCHLFSHPTAVNKQNVIDIVDYANRSDIPISAIVCGGDVISFNSGGDTPETKATYKAQLEEFFAIAKQSNVPFIFTKGNHDLVDTYPSTVLTDDDYGELWLNYAEEKFGIVRQLKSNGKKSTWHYYDDETFKVRFISLDCYDLDKSITDGDGKVKYWGGTSEYFSNEQFNWVINTALNFDDKDEKDWGVIVTFHNYEDKVWGTGIAPLYENALDKMSKVFNAFNTQSTYSNTYSFQYPSFDLNFSADFTRYAGLEKKPYFITCLIGHTHYDTYLTSDNIIKIKSENTACYHASTCDSRIARIPGTNSQNCFDVVNIDTVTQKIRAFRYGAGLNCFCEGGDRFLPDGLDYKTCYVGFSKGPSSHRPIGIHDTGNGNYVGQLRPNEDVGFAYYDTDLSMNIYASEIDSISGVVIWRDALGNTL